MTKTMLQECIDIVKDIAHHEYLYFDAAVEVKATPHSVPFSAWGVCVSPSNDLYVMDAGEQWHKVELGDANATLVIGSLYQRIRLMRINYAKAS